MISGLYVKVCSFFCALSFMMRYCFMNYCQYFETQWNRVRSKCELFLQSELTGEKKEKEGFLEGLLDTKRHRL